MTFDSLQRPILGVNAKNVRWFLAGGGVWLLLVGLDWCILGLVHCLTENNFFFLQPSWQHEFYHRLPGNKMTTFENTNMKRFFKWKFLNKGDVLGINQRDQMILLYF